MALENITQVQGALKDSFQKLQPETIQHSDEITNARRDDKSLRNKWFYTADHAEYTSKKGKSFFHLGRGHTSPIFKNIEEATRQLIKDGNYVPSKQDIEAVLNDKSTLTIELPALELVKHSDEWGYLEINTSNPLKGKNTEQRQVIKRAFGRGKAFEENMKMLKDAGIDTTKIYALIENYVKSNTRNNDGISRACWLSGFDDDSSFGARDRIVGGSYFWLRGVPRIAEGDAKNIEVPTLKQILDLSKGYVPEKLAREFEVKIKELYK